MEKEFLRRVQKTIERYNMLQRGDKVIVGVSGGADSMALLTALHCLKKPYQLNLWIAHYDHRLRGEESDTESTFVRKQAQQLDVAMITEEDDGSLRMQGENLEEVARTKRYQFFKATV